ncbi:HEAT repeat domain-containing protein [Motilibacter deserti]|uniref:HEAT repeat protein n=1 Tax=Motilibacter deserti TaxID=2714956 RepID=A0ABX0GSU9_9ACTN|nr:HEAT repeat domain-containing protein [Motilibacter deserti]NHC12749.1 hypothetical protein [Motilibacter deserti]
MPSNLQEEARRLGSSLEGSPQMVPTAVPRLAQILQLAAADEMVVEEAVDALGKAWDASAAQALLDAVRLDHPSAAVRLALARALPGGVVTAGPLRDRVVAALTQLSTDEHARVRDWAAFGLGQVEADSPAARDALAARLHDPDPQARCEALLALARTGDHRAVDALLQRLDGADDDLWRQELEAAAVLADPALHEALERLGQEWAGDQDEFTDVLALARARCRPDAAGQAAAAEARTLRAVRAALPAGVTAQLRHAYPRTVVAIAHASLGEIELALWGELENPWAYDATAVLNAVAGTFGGLPADRRR